MTTSKKTSTGRSAKGGLSLWKTLTSLKLTMVLLVCSMVLVFWGTLAQVEIGLWEAQREYFRSFFVMWGPKGSDWKIPVFPGGYLVGGLLLINLIAAHAYRFKWSAKKAGIFLVHIGLILMLVGQLFTELLQVESSIRLEEGESKNYAESFRDNELAVVDTSGGTLDSAPLQKSRETGNKLQQQSNANNCARYIRRQPTGIPHDLKHSNSRVRLIKTSLIISLPSVTHRVIHKDFLLEPFGV